MLTRAEKLYPDGLPCLLRMGEFANLMGVSRPTAMRIVDKYPEYTEPNGKTRWIKSSLYEKLNAVNKETA